MNEHGGVALYGADKIKSEVIKDINCLSVCGEFECTGAHFVINRQKIVAIVVYRPPNGSVGVFLRKLEELLSIVFEYNEPTFIAGDFNIELKNDNDKKIQIMSLLNSFNFILTVTEYTRITSKTNSCIDNIFTNYENTFSIEILNTHISDHTAQKIMFNLSTTRKNIQKFKQKRFFTYENKITFTNVLNEQTWESVYNCRSNEINEQWATFMNTFLCIFNHSFPCKIVKADNSEKRVNILNDDVQKCKQRLDLLLMLSRVNILYKDAYDVTKKEYDELLKKAKAEMYEMKVMKSNNKSKCMWAIFNQITGRQRKNELPIEGDPINLANSFNNHLVSMAPDLISKLENVPFNCKVLDNTQSMFLKALSPEDILEVTATLQNKFSHGDDEIPTGIIKYCINEIKEVLSYIINNSFKYGIFPDQLKLANIIMLFKSGNQQVMNNYRPISLLPSFSKIFEAAFCRQLVSFMNKCDLFSEFQHGYLTGRSTQTAIFQFLTSILNFFEDRNVGLGIFLDLSKAYDSLNHELLLIKIEKYGVRGNAFNWVKSYLTNRNQRVKVQKDGVTFKSDILYNSTGVPQGSILGPVLFVIYCNDLYNIISKENETITNYADDSNILVSAESYPDLLRDSRCIFKRASEWYAANKLTLNKEKTKLVFFRTKQMKLDTPNNVVFDGQILSFVGDACFLGLQFNENLDWESHINSLCGKLNSVCYSIRIISNYLNDRTLKTLYFANFESVVRYGIIFWGRDINVDNIFVIQKRIIRIIYKIKYRQSCRGIFKVNKILTIHALYIYECLMFLFKNKEKFLQDSTEHNYNTRYVNITYPKHHLTLVEKSARYMCIKLYNKLPNYIKLINMVEQFKKEIKALLIDVEPYSPQDFLNYEF